MFFKRIIDGFRLALRRKGVGGAIIILAALACSGADCWSSSMTGLLGGPCGSDPYPCDDALVCNEDDICSLPFNCREADQPCSLGDGVKRTCVYTSSDHDVFACMTTCGAGQRECDGVRAFPPNYAKEYAAYCKQDISGVFRCSIEREQKAGEGCSASTQCESNLLCDPETHLCAEP
jgi:hypothetical protein